MRLGPAWTTSVTSPGAIDDDLMAEARSSPQLRLDIGAHSAAEGRVKRSNVDNPHAVEKPGQA